LFSVTPMLINQIYSHKVSESFASIREAHSQKACFIFFILFV